jgi:hypothetical protein
MELMKFRTEDNCNLVNYLEKKLNSKDIQLMEQSFELDTWRSADNTINSNGLTRLASDLGGHYHETSLNSFSFSNSLKHNNNGATGGGGGTHLATKKTVPVDVIFSSDPDVVISTVSSPSYGSAS